MTLADIIEKQFELVWFNHIKENHDLITILKNLDPNIVKTNCNGGIDEQSGVSETSTDSTPEEQKVEATEIDTVILEKLIDKFSEETFDFSEEILDELKTNEECNNKLNRLRYELMREEYRLSWLEKEFEIVSEDVYNEALHEDLKQEKLEKKQKNILYELLQTEENYVSALEVLQKVYLSPMKDKQLISQQTMDNIFFKVEDILQFHKTLCYKIGVIVRKWLTHESTKLSLIFTDLDGLFEDYLKFTENYSKSLSALRKCNSDHEFSRFIEGCLDNPINKTRYRIQDVLIMPIQRIPRYSLLIESFLKTVNETYHDYEQLSEAQGRLNETARLINEGKRYADSFEEVYELSLKLTGYFDQLEIPERRLLENDCVVEVKDTTRLWTQVVLFSDSVLGAKPKTNGEFKFNWLLPLEETTCDAVIINSDKREVTAIAATYSQIEREMQSESGRIQRAQGKSKTATSKLDGLHVKLKEFQHKLDLMSRIHGIRLSVAGKRNKIVVFLFNSLEARDLWHVQFKNNKAMHREKLKTGAVTSAGVKKRKLFDRLTHKEKESNLECRTVTGFLTIKFYGITMTNPETKDTVTCNVLIDTADGAYKQKVEVKITENSIIENPEEIPDSQIFLVDAVEAQNLKLTVTKPIQKKDNEQTADSQPYEDEVEILGSGAVDLNELDTFAQDYDISLPNLKLENDVEEYIVVKCQITLRESVRN